MTYHKGSLSRTDDDLLAGVLAWAKAVDDDWRNAQQPPVRAKSDEELLERYVFHVELTYADVSQRFGRLPPDTELPVVTYVYAGTVVTEEAISVGKVGGAYRHQYELVVHQSGRGDDPGRRTQSSAAGLHESGSFELADLLAGLLREQRFRVTFQPEGAARDASEHTVGVFAERE